MVFTAKKKSKNRVADPTKNNPYLSQRTEKKWRPLYRSSHQKENVVLYLFIPSVFIEKPYLKKSIEKPTEFHGVMRRIVICFRIHTGEYLFFVQTRLAYHIQLRAFFIGKFAILEFTPASSPFLSSHRQVRHSWVHTGKLAIIVHTGKLAIIVHTGKLAIIVHTGKFAILEFLSARFAKFWVRSGKIRQFLSS
jgi:hypothetical protein